MHLIHSSAHLTDDFNVVRNVKYCSRAPDEIDLLCLGPMQMKERPMNGTDRPNDIFHSAVHPLDGLGVDMKFN